MPFFILGTVVGLVSSIAVEISVNNSGDKSKRNKLVV